MLEKTVVVGPFQCNCRLLVCPRTGEAVLVDPGDEARSILSCLHHLKTPTGAPIQVKFLLHTHAHLDHIGATRAVREALVQEKPAGTQGSPLIAVHRGDEMLYQNLKMQGQLFGIKYDDPLPIDHYLQDEEELQVGDLKFTILHTPGHSPGSVCFRLHQDTGAGVPEVLYTGDTLFQGSVGRTDLWGGDQDQMFQSIQNRILNLEDEIRVCPGHGADTSIGREKRENPFLQGF